MSLIKGIHHVALKCCGKEEFEKTKQFYGEVLGLPVTRSWEGGIMYDTGAGLMEILRRRRLRWRQERSVILHLLWGIRMLCGSGSYCRV